MSLFFLCQLDDELDVVTLLLRRGTLIAGVMARSALELARVPLPLNVSKSALVAGHGIGRLTDVPGTTNAKGSWEIICHVEDLGAQLSGFLSL